MDEIPTFTGSRVTRLFSKISKPVVTTLDIVSEMNTYLKEGDEMTDQEEEEDNGLHR